MKKQTNKQTRTPEAAPPLQVYVPLQVYALDGKGKVELKADTACARCDEQKKRGMRVFTRYEGPELKRAGRDVVCLKCIRRDPRLAPFFPRDGETPAQAKARAEGLAR